MNIIAKGLIIIAALNFITCTMSLSKTPRLVVLLVVDQMGQTCLPGLMIYTEVVLDGL